VSALAQARSRTANAARRLRGVPEGARGLAARLGQGAAHEPRRRRLAWIGVAVLLTLGPLVFTLARASEFTASVQLFPSPVPPFPAEYSPAAYRAFLRDPILQREMRRNVAAEPGDYKDAQIRPAAPLGTLAISVSAGDPARAQALANALGLQLIVAEQRRTAARATDAARRLNARLRSGRMPRAAKPRIRRRLRRVQSVLPLSDVAGGVLGPRARRPRLTRVADRIVDALPGDFSPRPNPLLAALAGLVVALTLWLVALALVPPPRDG
jgi:hypothetical protein